MKIALTGRQRRHRPRHHHRRRWHAGPRARLHRPRRSARDRGDTRTSHFIQADMDDYDKLVDAFAGCDAVIHMAAIPSPGPPPRPRRPQQQRRGQLQRAAAAVENGIMRICQASSVNAIGHSYSRDPHYDYLPLDEEHPNYSEEPYSLSKWICEAQADTFARRYEDISHRQHALPLGGAGARRWRPRTSRSTPSHRKKHLFAYTRFDAAARACLLEPRGQVQGPRGVLHRRARHHDSTSRASRWRPSSSPTCRSRATSAATRASSIRQSRAHARLEARPDISADGSRATLIEAWRPQPNRGPAG